MAIRTIVTCDLCKEEIKTGERVLFLSATRWTDPNGHRPLAKFDVSEFCSDACVIAAVRGLLNGGT